MEMEKSRVGKRRRSVQAGIYEAAKEVVVERGA